MNTQLSSPETYDVSKMVFSKAIKGANKVSEGEPQIKFSRIMVNTKNDDGSLGELVFSTTELFSFGVSTNTNQDTGKVNGYSLPICLWNKDAPTSQEKAFSSKLEEVVEKCKDHLLLDSTKEETEKYDLERSELKKLNSFIYWKRDKGKVVEGTGPTLYPKLIESKKNNKIITSFFDQNGNDIDPLNLIGKYCWAKVAIKIESIFVGAKIALQVKVYEAEIRLIESGVKRLLRRPTSDTKVQIQTSNSTPQILGGGDEDEDGESENEEQIRDEAPPKEITPPVVQEQTAPVRKVIRKIVTKK